MKFVRSLSRRTFLAASGALALAACGSSSDDGSSDGDDGGDGGGDVGDIAGAAVLARFNTYVLTPGFVRLPVSFGKDDVILTDGPDQVTGRIVDLDGNVVIDGLVAAKHNEGIPNAYWLFTAQLDTPDLYRLVVDGADPAGQAVQINEAQFVAIPKVGEALPPFDTPTTDDGRGVDPICTHEPECPLHGITLTEALTQGKPVVYLIGTPAYCQTGFCGPILDLMLEVRDELGDGAVYVHSEVYTDDTITAAAPAVTAYQLDFEPVLYITDASGTIVSRLDAAWDKAEMADAISAVLA